MSSCEAVPRLPDILAPNLQVLFVGINPGMRSATVGHHYAGHGNRFWTLLYESGLITEPLSWSDDHRVVEWGLGLTNLVTRVTRGVAGLTTNDLETGRRRLLQVLGCWQPQTVALVGITVARQLLDQRGPVPLGRAAQKFDGRPVFVLPNPSGRNAHYHYNEMLRAFRLVATKAMR